MAQSTPGANTPTMIGVGPGEPFAQPGENLMSRLRRIALTVSVAALVSLPPAGTAFAGSGRLRNDEGPAG